jgi:hypothetical protein
MAISNASAYLGVAAFEFALLVGLGLASLFPGVAAVSFGRRHLGAGFMAALLAVGLGGQAFQALEGSWTVGREGGPAAYTVVRQSSATPFRVLWLGKPGGQPFPAPGGLPERNVPAGAASVRFAVTIQSGASALDVGRPPAGPGYDALGRALSDILAGETQHGGALLAPFAISYVMAAPADLPTAAFRRLTTQLDLDLLPTPGLTILRNEKAVLPASVIQSAEWLRAANSGDPSGRTELPVLSNADPLSGDGEQYSGAAPATRALVLLSQQFDGAWRLTPSSGGTAIRPSKSFGWAVGFESPSAPSSFIVRFGGQETKRAEVALLALLWLAALWMTRRPVRAR